ncbi:hypothetical protein FACS189431_6560 [Alphaproteobacteria bacterium]|nr:hypothetical protein FACS189431_6560 [Alphaproteobacteria bacterium]
MDKYFDNIKNLIDSNGSFIGTPQDKKLSITEVESLAVSILGCTLHVHGKEFIIRMLEIYYGGIGDDAHDWYRTHFIFKKAKNKERTEVQTKEGFRVYLSTPNVSYRYTRFDIVVGHEGVPVSFLIRSVWDSDFKIIGAKKGSPNIILKAMKLENDDHDKIIGYNNSKNGIYIENASDTVINSKKVKKQRRINVTSQFEEENKVFWNFSLE